MTKKELIKNIVDSTEYSEPAVAKIVNSCISELNRCFNTKEEVKIVNFGNFSYTEKYDKLHGDYVIVRFKRSKNAKKKEL